jgi:hypothetical protein
MASSTAALSVNMPAPAPFNTGDVVLVADQVTGIVAGTPATLQHSATGLNASTDLGRAFALDAVVMPIRTITYYVAPSSVVPTNTETSLWRVVGTNAPEEVIEGVVAMRVFYGEDTDGDFYANWYVTAENVGVMNNVVALRLDLLFASRDNYLADKAGRILFNGTSASATDQRLYRPFSTTVMLRNRSL